MEPTDEFGIKMVDFGGIVKSVRRSKKKTFLAIATVAGGSLITVALGKNWIIYGKTSLLIS